MRNMITKAVFDKTFKAGDKFAEPIPEIDATFQHADSAGFQFPDQGPSDTVTQSDVVGDDRLPLSTTCWCGAEVQRRPDGPQFPPHTSRRTSTELASAAHDGGGPRRRRSRPV